MGKFLLGLTRLSHPNPGRVPARLSRGYTREGHTQDQSQGHARPDSEGTGEPPGLRAWTDAWAPCLDLRPRSLPRFLAWPPGRNSQDAAARPPAHRRSQRAWVQAQRRGPGLRDRPTAGRARTDASPRRPGLAGARTALGPSQASASPARAGRPCRPWSQPSIAARSVPAHRLP